MSPSSTHSRMAQSSRPLTTLARSILQQAELLETQLDAASLPQPSSSSNTPLTYPSSASYPDVFAIRMALIDSLNALLPLVEGPVEHLRVLIGPVKFQLAILRTIIAFRIHEFVPFVGSISIEELSKKAAVKPDLLKRLLRHSFSSNLFCEPQPDQIAHTALSSGIAPLVPWIQLCLDDQAWKSLVYFPESVRSHQNPNQTNSPTAIPFELAHSEKFFDWVNQNSYMPTFTAAMAAHSRISDSSNNEGVRSLFPWAVVKSGTVIDLGGGNGHATIAAAQGFPDMKVIVQDVPNNRPECEELIQKTGLADRVRFMEQDFFTPQPKELVESGNVKAIFLRVILHDWPDEKCVQILGMLIPYMKQGAKCFVMDRIVPSTRSREDTGIELSKHEQSLLTTIDLLMFTVLGSRERTKEEFEELCSLTNKHFQQDLGGELLKVEGLKIVRGCEMGGVVIGI